MYIRLSLEDEDLDEDKTESGSVGNQREFLYHFLEEHPDISAGAVKELIDDGYSGTNLERPGMQELLRRVRTGNVQTVIVKDDCVIIEPTQKDLENQGFVAGSICF